MTRRLAALLALIALVVASSNAVAQQQSVLRGMSPKFVFEVIVQVDNAHDYHEYRVGDSGTVCDYSRPATVRKCDVNIIAIAETLATLTVREWIPSRPAWVHWTWDWEHMKPYGGKYTPIAFNALVRQYDGKTAHRWYVACSVNDAQTEGFCMVYDRMDHFNYVLVDAVQVIAITDALR